MTESTHVEQLKVESLTGPDHLTPSATQGSEKSGTSNSEVHYTSILTAALIPCVQFFPVCIVFKHHGPKSFVTSCWFHFPD